MEKIKSFKGFNKDLTCRGFQYQEGEEYETNEAKSCEKGFHACPYPLDVFDYYPPADSVYHEVEQSGELDRSESNKIASTRIKIGARLDIRGLIEAAIEYVKERCTNQFNAEPGKAATAGDSGAATAGYRGAATAGNYGAATARGKASSGEYGLSVVRGYKVQAKGGIGALLVFAEESENSYEIKHWKAIVVDGEKVKPNTWYQLDENGELIESKE